MARSTLMYPQVEKSERHETLHGITISDPWAWMQDSSDHRLRKWLESQQALVFAGCDEPGIRAEIEALLKRLPTDVPRRLPQRRGGRWYRVIQTDDGRWRIAVGAGQENQIVWEGDTHQPEDDQHTRLAAEFVSVSPTGRYIALPFSKPGTDDHRLHIWDCGTQRFLAGRTSKTILPLVAWHTSEQCFFFSVSMFEGADSRTVAVHGCSINPRMGLQERLVFDDSEGAAHAVLPCIPEGDDYLLLKPIDFVTQRAGLLCRRLDQSEGRFRPVISGLQAPFTIVGVTDSELYIETRDDAPCGRVLTCNLASSGTEWREVIPDQERVIVPTSHSCASNACVVMGEYLAITYVEDVRSVIVLHGMDGRIGRTVNLPVPGSVLELLADEHAESLHVAVTSYLTPYSRYRYVVSDDSWHLEEQVSSGIELADVTETQYFCQSSDGVRVPMTVLQSGQARAGESPVLMYGYGGWGSSLLPQYRPELLLWLALGGTFVVINTRGGGEYGALWHQGGQRERKKQVFEDFEAAAEYLQNSGVAQPDRTAIFGLSNGGLLVAAVVNRRPELFAAAVAEVPLVDVVHLMQLPIGPAVAAELGDPEADATMFEYMLSYSPLQNVRPNENRPAVMVVAAERDDRAPPAWAYRYVATMQDTALPGQEVFLRVVENEGHVGWPAGTVYDVMIDKLTFLWRHVGQR